MIYIGLGANLPSPVHGPPLATLQAALKALADVGVRPLRCSSFWRSAPVPLPGQESVAAQPWYVNAVAAVETELDPAALLAAMNRVEAAFGRVRGERGLARVLDLDVLDYHGRVQVDALPEMPHPRMAERAFVLLPLAEIAPDWRHPADGRAISALLAALPDGQEIARIGA
jgi:2-amino-4-hydroxy-6-hydroxymethyldihydropteridine diphosphokinase